MGKDGEGFLILSSFAAFAWSPQQATSTFCERGKGEHAGARGSAHRVRFEKRRGADRCPCGVRPPSSKNRLEIGLERENGSNACGALTRVSRRDERTRRRFMREIRGPRAMARGYGDSDHYHVSRLLNFLVTTLPMSMPRRSTIRWARSGCEVPLKTLMFGILLCKTRTRELSKFALNKLLARTGCDTGITTTETTGAVGQSVIARVPDVTSLEHAPPTARGGILARKTERSSLIATYHHLSRGARPSFSLPSPPSFSHAWGITISDTIPNV